MNSAKQRHLSLAQSWRCANELLYLHHQHLVSRRTSTARRNGAAAARAKITAKAEHRLCSGLSFKRVVKIRLSPSTRCECECECRSRSLNGNTTKRRRNTLVHKLLRSTILFTITAENPLGIKRHRSRRANNRLLLDLCSINPRPLWICRSKGYLGKWCENGYAVAFNYDAKLVRTCASVLQRIGANYGQAAIYMYLPSTTRKHQMVRQILPCVSLPPTILNTRTPIAATRL